MSQREYWIVEPGDPLCIPIRNRNGNVDGFSTLAATEWGIYFPDNSSFYTLEQLEFFVNEVKTEMKGPEVCQLRLFDGGKR